MDVCKIASHEIINDLKRVSENGTEQQIRAARIAMQALLAMRDTVNRPYETDVYEHRMNQIRFMTIPTNQPEKYGIGTFTILDLGDTYNVHNEDQLNQLIWECRDHGFKFTFNPTQE